jgi:hypothetical protein
VCVCAAHCWLGPMCVDDYELFLLELLIRALARHCIVL